MHATLYDEWGVAVPSTGARRVDWVRLDDGIQFETYDAIRDSVRVRLQLAGTHKVSEGRGANALRLSSPPRP
jgi:hypothetical protein